MITCQEMLDFVTDYENDELDRAQRTLVDEHLAACPPCIEYMKSYRATLALSAGAMADLSQALEGHFSTAVFLALNRVRGV